MSSGRIAIWSNEIINSSSVLTKIEENALQRIIPLWKPEVLCFQSFRLLDGGQQLALNSRSIVVRIHLMIKGLHIGFCFALVAAFALPNCTKDNALLVDPAVDCDTVTVSFANDVAPLLALKCGTGQGDGTGCHDSWAFDYDIISGKANNGRLESYVIANRTMPPIPNDWDITPLTEAEINLVHCWLYDGALNN